MAQALAHLQQLHPSGGSTAAQQSKKVHRATRNATSALYELLRALEGALDPATYLQVGSTCNAPGLHGFAAKMEHSAKPDCAYQW